MLSQLRTAVVPPPPPSAHQFTRHPRPPPSQTVPGSHLSPLAPAPPLQLLVNGHANGALSNNWTSVNHDPYIPFPHHSGAMAGGPPWTDAEKIQLLVEILKDCEVVAPNWRNIRVPSGRTSLQAQQIFALLTTSPDNSPAASPTAVSAPPPPPPPPVQQQPPPQPTAAPTRKRSNPSQNPNAPKRKRGRPSKADIALREQSQGGTSTATWQPQMYTPDQGRGGVSLLAAAVGGAAGSQQGSIQQQLSQLPPLKKKRGRPTKAEMEARRERERLEILAAQRVHGGDLPADVEEQERQKLETEEGQTRRLGNELEAELAAAQALDIEDDDSEEGGADSPDTED
ncbi:hypothetical protein BZA05DRAFT_392235 [Tricharina praecox]|uniref:uncharacterized protein n=1 Tax=Tricharina praecox TaxID=43433 RepID=UPI00221E614F|nr:uncharacterized protein BZA05DRAFT_392235 [Tricharina praecox]KAI5854677.1 hypothetical protein BZA05DRAFT_392235 [Tricharina praecox]